MALVPGCLRILSSLRLVLLAVFHLRNHCKQQRVHPLLGVGKARQGWRALYLIIGAMWRTHRAQFDAASGGMSQVRARGRHSSALVGTPSTGRLARLGAPRSHQAIGGAPCSWLAVNWTLPMLQNFQSSFEAREYWNKTSSTSKALSSPLRNRSIASATCATSPASSASW